MGARKGYAPNSSWQGVDGRKGEDSTRIRSQATSMHLPLLPFCSAFCYRKALPYALQGFLPVTASKIGEAAIGRQASGFHSVSFSLSREQHILARVAQTLTS